MKESLSVLRNCPLFTGLEDHEILSILDNIVMATKASRSSGSHISRENDSAGVIGLKLIGSTLIIQKDRYK